VLWATEIFASRSHVGVSLFVRGGRKGTTQCGVDKGEYGVLMVKQNGIMEFIDLFRLLWDIALLGYLFLYIQRRCSVLVGVLSNIQ